jgi:hypothetical protein
MSIGDHLFKHVEKYIIGGIVAIVAGALYYNYGPHSRRTLNPAGTTIEYKLPQDFRRMINVSSGGSEGDMMLTYETLDGKLMTKEYNRLGLWQTDIKWLKSDNQRPADQE